MVQKPIPSGLIEDVIATGYIFNAKSGHPNRVGGPNHKPLNVNLIPLNGGPFNCINPKTNQTEQVTISQKIASINNSKGWTENIKEICRNAEFNSRINPNGTAYIFEASGNKTSATCKDPNTKKLYNSHYHRNLTACSPNGGGHGSNPVAQHIKNQKKIDITSTNDTICKDYSNENPGPNTLNPKKTGGVSLWTRNYEHQCKPLTVRMTDTELAKVHPCWVDQYKQNDNPKWNKLDRHNPAKQGSGPYAQQFCYNVCPDFYKAYGIDESNVQEGCKPSAWQTYVNNNQKNCKPCPNKESFIGKKKLKQNKKNYLKYHVSPIQSNIDSDNIIQNIYIGCLSIVGIYIIYELYKKK